MEQPTTGTPVDLSLADGQSRFALEFGPGDHQRICQIAKQHGLDRATELLYQAVKTSARHASAIELIDQYVGADPQKSEGRFPSDEIQMAIVPGFLYREYPSSGADGRLLVEAAEKRGWKWDRVPVGSTGRLVENGEAIVKWLQENGDRPTVLASISKGGSDIVQALRHRDADEAFRNVVGWVNVCGIINGSPVVDAMSKRRLAMLGFRLMFFLRRWTFQSVLDLRYGGGTLRGGFALPKRMKTVHVVGFPDEADFVHSRLRSFRNLVGSLGPNDGAILLLDSIHAQGVVYPVRGADHYMRPRHKVQPLINGILDYLMTDDSQGPVDV